MPEEKKVSVQFNLTFDAKLTHLQIEDEIRHRLGANNEQESLGQITSFEVNSIKG